MKSLYELKDGSIVSSTSEQANILVYTTPTEPEKHELMETLQLDQHDLESALDPDEISRVDVTPDYIYTIWKRPNNVSFEQALKFEGITMKDIDARSYSEKAPPRSATGNSMASPR